MPVSTKRVTPLITVLDVLVGGLVKLVVWHGFRPSTTTTSRYLSTKFVPVLNGCVTRARFSDKTISDELGGNRNWKPYFVLKYPWAAGGTEGVVGMAVGGCNVIVGCIGVRVGGRVAVGGTGVAGICDVSVGRAGVEVSVDAGIDVEVGTGVLGNGVTVGYALPLLTTLGATQSARSPVGKPFASALRINFTVCPANGLKSTSA